MWNCTRGSGGRMSWQGTGRLGTVLSLISARIHTMATKIVRPVRQTRRGCSTSGYPTVEGSGKIGLKVWELCIFRVGRSLRGDSGMVPHKGRAGFLGMHIVYKIERMARLWMGCGKMVCLFRGKLLMLYLGGRWRVEVADVESELVMGLSC